MHDAINALILGIIEGLTEFLPVSSTGHMVIAMPLLGVDATVPLWKAFLFFIQIGAILAVVLYFWRRLWRQIVVWPTAGWSSHLTTKIMVGALPAGVIGLLFHKFMEEHLEKPLPVAAALILGALVMVWIERRFRRETAGSISDISLKQAFLIGVAQCASIVPGTSRAMATIMGGLMVGLSPAVATEFSFYLAIPTLCGAGLLSLAKHRHDLHGDMFAVLGLGFAVAFVVALLVVAWFMRYIQTHKLAPFAVYRVILGVAVILWWVLYGQHHLPASTVAS